MTLSVVAILMLLFLAAAPAPASAAPLETPGGPGCGQFYTVRYGDNLYRIALRFHTSVSALMSLNGITNPNRIIAGQTICIKTGGEIPFGFLYQVRRGDTLYSIARRNGWSASYLASVNHLGNPNQIYAGQILLIPYH
jgi:LysM repeat protein